jgi:hypothetical protein
VQLAADQTSDVDGSAATTAAVTTTTQPSSEQGTPLSQDEEQLAANLTDWLQAQNQANSAPSASVPELNLTSTPTNHLAAEQNAEQATGSEITEQTASQVQNIDYPLPSSPMICAFCFKTSHTEQDCPRALMLADGSTEAD